MLIILFSQTCLFSCIYRMEQWKRKSNQHIQPTRRTKQAPHREEGGIPCNVERIVNKQAFPNQNKTQHIDLKYVII